MAEKFVLRVKKIKNQLLVTASGQHNFREKVSDNVDPTRSHLNENLGRATNSQELYALVSECVEDETLKKDAKSTKVMEFVISASPEQLSQPEFDQTKFFKDSLKFVESLHGAENVMSATIHRDEDTPHMHVHVVPINQIEAATRKRSVQVKGGKAGEREIREFVVEAHFTLSANVLYGGPRKLSALQTAFEEQVGIEHGLSREKRFIEGQAYSAEQNVSPRQYRAKLDAIAERLEVRESDVTMNFAKIDRHWEVLERDKSRLADDQARLTGELEAVAAQKWNLDAQVVNLANGQRLLAVDREKFVQESEDLAKRISALNDREAALKEGLADLTKRQGEMDLRSSQLDQATAAVAHDREILSRVGPKLDAREADLNSRESGLFDRGVALDQREDRVAAKESKFTEWAKAETGKLNDLLKQVTTDVVGAYHNLKKMVEEREAKKAAKAQSTGRKM